jgi:hypothetical protein
MPHRGFKSRLAWTPFLALALTVATMAPAEAASTLRQHPVPVVADASALTVCGWPAMPTGMACALYDGNGDASLGESTFGFANLDTWNTRSADACMNAGAATLDDWLAYGYPDLLALNGDPHGSVPTFVCRDTGEASATFAALTARVGSVAVIIVNDCDGQVDATGTSDPCPQEPHKFDAIGFERFRIVQVLKGNDPAAIGSVGPPATPGACGLRLSDPTSICLVLRAVAPTVGLDVILRGTVGGSVRGLGVRCRRSAAQCRFAVPWGRALRLVAHPNAGAHFAGWTRGCNGTAPCWLPMRDHTVVRARFERRSV